MSRDCPRWCTGEHEQSAYQFHEGEAVKVGEGYGAAFAMPYQRDTTLEQGPPTVMVFATTGLPFELSPESARGLAAIADVLDTPGAAKGFAAALRTQADLIAPEPEAG